MSNHGPLTISDLTALHVIAEAAHLGAKVRWLDDKSGLVLAGTARSVVVWSGDFLSGNDDVRDAFLRITTKSGFERFVPVSVLVAKVQRGEFAID